MSKTDKTRPAWVRERDPLEEREEHHYHRRWINGYGPVRFDCTLGEDLGRARRGRYSECGYSLRYAWHRHTPRWFRHANWYEPERSRERDELSRAVRLANTGEMDDGFDFENRQHRRSAG